MVTLYLVRLAVRHPVHCPLCLGCDKINVEVARCMAIEPFPEGARECIERIVCAIQTGVIASQERSDRRLLSMWNPYKLDKANV